jgi:hypothetical protein
MFFYFILSAISDKTCNIINSKDKNTKFVVTCWQEQITLKVTCNMIGGTIVTQSLSNKNLLKERCAKHQFSQ